MPSLTITVEPKNYLRLTVGAKVRRLKAGASSSGVDQAAKHLGLDSDWLQSCLDKGAGEYDIPVPAIADTAAVEAPPFPHPVFVRGRLAQGATGQRFDSLADALRCTDLTVAEPLIYWEGKDRLCAVDVDLHHVEDRTQRFIEAQLGTRFLNLQPAPRYIWVTHGQGLRLIYEDREGYSAEELAAVGACRVKQLEPLVTVELRSVTRHPGYPDAEGKRASAVHEREPTTDVSAVQGWCVGRGEADEDAVQEWLTQRGWVINGRYDHDQCPVDPTDASEKGPPVVVYTDGVMCFRCQGKGIRRGHKAPGWFTWATLLGEPCVSDVARCVQNLIHWEHAKFILAAHFDLPEAVLRGAYATMIKGRPNTDPRIAAKVFTAGQDIVRYHKRWGTVEGEAFANQYIKPILESLPACQFVNEKGEVKASAEKVARFLQTTSLERYGYPHLRPIFGLPMNSKEYRRYPYEVVLHKAEGEPPRYIPKSQRIPEEEAWTRIQNAFPGYTRPLIQLLICAKGCAEFDGTWAPFIFIDGPTKAAKTTSVLLAAAIAGDRSYSVQCISDEERIRAAILEAKSKGTYCTFNEVVKDGRRMGRGPIDSMEFILGLTPDSMSHKLYIGPVEMGQLPVCVWTDVWCPNEVKRHAQLARRLVYVHLRDPVDWHATMIETRMGKAENLRVPIYGDRTYIEAADCILSSIMDRFFHVPQTFEQIANQLGFRTLADSHEAQDQYAELEHFYHLVQEAPKENGEVVIEISSSTALAQCWKQLGEERVREVHWPTVLGIPGIECHITQRQSRVRVRFDGSVRGHRDAEHGRPEGPGSEALHLPSIDALDDASDAGRGHHSCVDAARAAWDTATLAGAGVYSNGP